MAKKAKGSKQQTKAPLKADNNCKEHPSLKALDPVSTEEEDGIDDGKQEEWNTEALVLMQAIADGSFDPLMKKLTRMKKIAKSWRTVMNLRMMKENSLQRIL